MGQGLAAFIAGAGTGYLKSRERAEEKARQNKLDQITFDRADREKTDAEKKAKYEADLADAGKARATEDMSTVDIKKDDEGNDMPAVPQYRVGTSRFGTKEEADAVVTAENKPEALLARQVGVMQGAGKVNEAMALQTSAKQAKLADFQLKDAEIAQVDKDTNRAIDKRFTEAGNWIDGAASILTDTQVGRMAGVEVKPVISADKKTVEFHAVGQDGTSRVIKSYPNDSNGEEKARKDFMAVPPEKRIEWLHESNKAEQTQLNADREFGLKSDQLKATIAHYKATEGNARAQLALTKQSRDLEREKFDYLKKGDVFSQMDAGDKIRIQTLQKELDQVGGALAKSQADGTFAATTRGKDGSESMNPVLVRQSRLSNELNDIAKRYSKDGGGAQDPLNMNPFGPPAPPAQPSRTAPPAAAPAVSAAPAAAQGVQQPPPPPAPTAAANILKDNPAAVAAIKPLLDAAKQEEAVMAAVVRSGDQVAIQRQAQKLQIARTELEKSAQKQFGGSAAEVINAISAQ
jgi:hypothetical protein